MHHDESRSGRSDLAVAAGSARVEPLEARRLLSKAIDVFSATQLERFQPTTDNLLDVKTGPLSPAGGALANLYVNYRRAAKNGREFVPGESDAQLLMFDTQHVSVDLRTRIDFDTFAKRMKKLGMKIYAIDSNLRIVEGSLPISALYQVTTSPDVSQITPIFRPVTHQQGSAGNEADAGQNADTARTNFGLTGKNVVVGVLSDSVSQVDGGLDDSVSSGDLPASRKLNPEPPPTRFSDVNVLADSGSGLGGRATDEGRAMLELIHDIAPDAKLAFATASGGQLTFANHIRSLYSDAGARVIVDDAGYFAEPFFQPGVIDQAISEVVSKGATYLSAAGNAADSGFEQVAQYANLNNHLFVDFDPGTGVDRRMLVKVSDRGTMTLQWANPYNGVTGVVSADMDVRVYEPGTNDVINRYSSFDNNFATGVPVEMFGIGAGAFEIEIEVKLNRGTTAAPTAFKFTGDVGMYFTKYDGLRASTYGHSAGADTIGVGAVDFNDAPPVSSDTPINEDFSSTGPVTQVFDVNGNRLASPLTLQKPDISGIDGVTTSFFPSLFEPIFSGTSAAAPNVAACVALIKQAAPYATQAEILSALKATARPLNGSTAGTWDPQGGFGLIDINAALPLAVNAPHVTIVPVTPDPTTEVIESIKITFDQPVTGFTVSDLVLTRDGGANLLSGAQTLTNTPGSVTYTLGNLSSLTGVDGAYTLTLNSAGSGIVNLLGDALENNAADSWVKFTLDELPIRPRDLTAEAISSSAISLNWTDNNDNETGYQILRGFDAEFTSGYVWIKVGPNVHSYVDEDLKPGTRYYYRVRAFNLTGAGPYTAAQSAMTSITGDVVVDNNSAHVRRSGAWFASSAGTGFLGADYLTDSNASKGKNWIKYTPALAGSGQYYIYARWPKFSSNATNVPFDIFYGTNAAQHVTVLVNQRTRGGDGWVLIGGPFQMDSGSGAAVRIRNAGTNGAVLADAVRFLPGAPLTLNKSSANNSAATAAARSIGFTGPIFSSGRQIGQNTNGDDTDLALL